MKYPLTRRYRLAVETEDNSLAELDNALYDTCYLAFSALVFDAVPYMDADFRSRVYDPFETVKDVMAALQEEELYLLWEELDRNGSATFHGVSFTFYKYS